MQLPADDDLVLAAIDPADGFYAAWCLVAHAREGEFRERLKGHVFRVVTLREAGEILEAQQHMRTEMH